MSEAGSVAAGRAHWWHRRAGRWGLRRQSVVAAGVVVAVALLAGSAMLLVVLRTSLVSVARSGVVARSADVARLVADQGIGDAQSAVVEDRRGGEQVQVLDAAGRVVVSTSPRLRSSPISTLRPAPGRSASQELASQPLLGDADSGYLIGASGVRADGHSYVVLVAVPLDVQAETVRTVGLLLLVATPVAVAVVALAVWWLVGRSLRSVDRLRGQVAEISASRLDGRVGVPDTGDELAALAATMNAMLERLEQSDRSQRAFFSDASHELRSPLSTLVTTAEVAGLDRSGRTWLELQSTVLGETRRMQTLVEDLLTIAKADAGGLAMRMADVDLEDVAAAEVARLRTVSGLTIVAELEPARVRGDELRLAQVLRNLLDNAARHARTRVTVRVGGAAGRVRVLVDDDGDPIPPQDRGRVFERFVRLDADRTSEGGGSGLGLAIVQAIIERHGGAVTTTEADDGGCRFEVVLPAPQQNFDDADDPDAAEEADDPAATG